MNYPCFPRPSRTKNGMRGVTGLCLGHVNLMSPPACLVAALFGRHSPISGRSNLQTLALALFSFGVCGVTARRPPAAACMEHADPRLAAVEAAKLERFRRDRQLQEDSEFAYAFNTYEQACAAGLGAGGRLG